MKSIHCFLSLFLCLALMLFCLSSPLRSTASASATAAIVIGIGGATISVDAVIAVVATILVAVGLASGTVDEVVDQAIDFYNNCSSTLKEWFDDVAAEVIDGTSVFRIPSSVQKELKEELDDKPPDNIPYMFIPGTLTNLASLTGSDIFIQDVIGAIESGNSLTESTNTLLRTTYGLLNTSFAELYDSFDSLLSSFATLTTKLNTVNQNMVTLLKRLETSLGSVVTSVDAMSSTLSEDLSGLKSLYSSFGQATLDKLDTLNTSIQNINSDTGILDLHDLIAKNDIKLLTAVTDLPGLVSDSLSSFYETQSLQLETISDKLGTLEESFLETMSGDLQLIRDEVSLGFGDLLVALDNLDVNVSADMQPVIDQIFESEVNVVSCLDSLQITLNDVLTALDQLEITANADLQPVLDSISSMDASLNEVLYSSESALWSLYDIQSTSFESMISSLSSLDDQISYGLDTSIGALRAGLSNEFGSLKLNIADENLSLKQYLTGQLSDIKTELQAIAGTTTAGLDTSDHDDLENKKIPLYGSVVAGFDKGNEYFGFSGDFLSDDLNGFLVAGLIFNEFADMSFFHRLIIISASIGLVGTLLGMALDIQSYSVSQRRREEAAQARANSRFKGLEVYYG